MELEKEVLKEIERLGFKLIEDVDYLRYQIYGKDKSRLLYDQETDSIVCCYTVKKEEQKL